MSTDYDVVCHPCRQYRHLGQRFASGWAFGYGSNDEQGRKAVGEFIVEHEQHGALTVVESESTPDGFTDAQDLPVVAESQL